MRRKYMLDEPGLQLLRAKYDGSSAAIDELARRFHMPRHAIKKFALKYGLTRHKDPPWTRGEMEYLETHLHKMPYRAIAEHLSRTETAIKLKAKRLGIRKSGEGYTLRALLTGLGETDHHKVKRWVKAGWLKAARRESDRTDRQGGDMWLFTENAIRLFVRDYPQEIDQRKVDWPWLVEILVGSSLAPLPAPKRLREDVQHLRAQHISRSVQKKLTNEQVCAIRTRYFAGEVTQARLAAEYHVSGAAIGKIINHRSYRRVGKLE